MTKENRLKQQKPTRDWGKIFIIIGLAWAIVIAFCSAIGSSGMMRNIRKDLPFLETAITPFLVLGIFAIPAIMLIGISKHNHYKALRQTRLSMEASSAPRKEIETKIQFQNDEHYSVVGHVANLITISFMLMFLMAVWSPRTWEAGGSPAFSVLFLFPVPVALIVGLVAVGNVKKRKKRLLIAEAIADMVLLIVTIVSIIVKFGQ